jgi:hypothetical protein
MNKVKKYYKWKKTFRFTFFSFIKINFFFFLIFNIKLIKILNFLKLVHLSIIYIFIYKNEVICFNSCFSIISLKQANLKQRNILESKSFIVMGNFEATTYSCSLKYECYTFNF